MRDHHFIRRLFWPIRSGFVGWLLALLCLVTSSTSLFAANGTAEYFDVDSTTAGFGTPAGSYNIDGNYWSTDSSGVTAPGAMPNDRQWTFGSIGADFAGTTFTISANTSVPILGLLVNSTSANITLSGSSNEYLNGTQTWTVAAGSTLTEAFTFNGIGMDFNSSALTLAGGGTINFTTPIGYNSGSGGAGMITENGSGLVVNLSAAAQAGSPYGAGYTLTAGTLNFASSASADAFKDFTNSAKPFAIDGGTVNNTSGGAITLTVGTGGYSLGGNFTFTGSSSLNFGTAPVVLTGTRTITASANTLTMGGIISGNTYGITKAGAGTLTLSGANTYTGATVVSAGLLINNGVATGASAVTVNKNANLGGTGTLPGAVTLDVGDSTSAGAAIRLNDGAVGTLTLGSTLTLSGSATYPNRLTFDLGNGAGGTDKIVVSGAHSAAGASGSVLVDLNQLAGGVINPGTYTLIQGGAASTFTGYLLGSSTVGRNVFSGLGASGNNLVVTVATGSAGPADAFSYWKGSTSVWNTAQWYSDAAGTVTAVKPGYSSNVKFAATGGANLTNTLGQDFEINSLTVNSGNSTSISGNALTIDATTDNSNAAGNGITANESTTIASNVGLAASQTWTVASGKTLTVSGIIDDFGGGYQLTKAGSGDLSLSGKNTFTGGLSLTNGSISLLVAQSNNALGLPGFVNVTCASGTTLNVNRININGNLTLNGATVSGGNSFGDSWSGTIVLGAISTFNPGGNGTLRLFSNISGAGGLTHGGSGRGVVYLGGTNTYTGVTTVSGGILKISQPAALYNATAASWIPANVIVNSGGVFSLYVGGVSDFTTTQVGTIFTNLCTINNNGMKSGALFGFDTINGSATIATVLTDSVGTGGGAIGIKKFSSNTLTLTGANTYTGKTYLDDGSLSVASFNSVAGGTASSNLGAPTTVANGTIDFSNSGAGITGGITYTGTGETTDRVMNLAGQASTVTLDQSGTGLLKFTSAITVNNNSTKTITLQGSTAGTGEISSIIPNVGTLRITKSGSGTWTLSNANLNIGVTTVNAGVLRLNHATALTGGIGATGGLNNLTFNGGVIGLGADNFYRSLNTTATVDACTFSGIGGWAAFGADRLVNLGGASASITWATANTGFNAQTLILGTADATNMVTLQNPLDMTTAARTVQVDDGSAAIDATISGNITGGSGGNLTKTGTGTLALTGTNNYTGTTPINAGTLLINGTNSGTGILTVASAATLGGAGTVAGAISVSAGGTVAPGNTVGVRIDTLNTAAVTFAGGTYSVDLDGTTPSCDRINSTGTVALGTGVAALTVANATSSAVGKVYTIVSATSVTGTFFGMANGTTFTQAGRNLLITYTTTAVTLTDVSSLNAKVWNGGGGTNSWILGASWVGGVAPLAGDDLVFAGSVQTSPSNDYAADTSFGSITFATGTSAFTLAAGNRITLTGNITNNSSSIQAINIAMIANVATVTVDCLSNIILGGIVSESGGARTLTKTGTGTLIMSGTNTYTGATTVSAGTLQIGNAGTTGALSTSSAIVNNATLMFNRTDTITQGTNFKNVISGSGALIQMGAGGTLVLNGSNTYTGTTSVQNGTLSINTILDVSGGASAVGAPTTAGNGTIALGSTTTTGTLVYIGTAQNTNRVIDLAGTTGGGTIDQSGTGLLKFTSAVTATGAGAKSLTLQGSTAGTGEISAAIVNSASATALTKSGTDTWTLSGTNSYTGATTVSAGTLLVTGSTHAGSAVAVNGTGILGGTGTVNGTITMAAGGTIAPGSSGVSIMTLFAKTTVMHASSTYSVDLSGASSADLLSAAGQTVTCAGTLTVANNAGAALANTYTIISAGTVDTGRFSGLANNAVFAQGGRLYRITYTSTTVTLTDVAPVISSRETMDVNGNGKLDHIRLTFDQNLNGDVSGLTVTVAGYAVTGFDTATGDAAVIDVVITELGSADTGATPLVQITANTSLKDAAATRLVQVEGSGTAATDKAKPVLLSALHVDGGTNGVSGGDGDTLVLTFSENVTSASMVVGDLTLPVSGDTLSTSTIANKSTATPTITVTLMGTPLLSPGNTYASGTLGAGKPSGIYLSTAANLSDQATVPNTGLVGTLPADAVDIGASPSSSISIEWNDTNNTVDKTWTLGTAALSTLYASDTYTVKNIGYSTVALATTSSNSTSATTTWTVHPAVGANQFTMKADASTPLDAMYELTLSTSAITLAPFVRSGTTQDFKLQLSTPTTSATAATQAITVTITASQY